MDKEKVVIMVLVLIGLFMSLSGLLMVMYFNFRAVGLNLFIRLVGLGAGLTVLFIGIHIVVVGIASLLKK